MKKKFKIDKHYICAKCKACYFSDKAAAIECYDEHEEDYIDNGG